MLDVHPPHHAVHAWRDFFIHIATIVIGLCIAVGIEQTVEFFHHRHQLHKAEEALHDEGVTNRSIVDVGLSRIDTARQAIQANMAELDPEAPPNPAKTPRLVPYTSDTYIFMVSDSAWLSMRDSDLLPLVPPEVAHRYWKLDYTHHLIVDDNENIGRQREVVESLLHLHKDLATLSPTQREALFLAFSRLDQALVEMRVRLTIFRAVNDLAMSGKTLDADGFNTLTK